MDRDSESKLIKEFEAKYPYAKGYRFSYEYPGFFQFTRYDVSVCFTPDWGKDGEVCIQVNRDGGERCIEAEGVEYTAPLTAEKLFEIVSPWLKDYDRDYVRPTVSGSRIPPFDGDVKKWLAEMNNRHLLFHLDDSPWDICGNGEEFLFSENECEVLDKIVPQVFAACEDPFALYPDLESSDE